MKVKNSGSVFISIVIKDIRYDFLPNDVLVFPDKDEASVDAAIKPYTDLNVILENTQEGADTTAEIAAAVSASNSAHLLAADPHTQYQKESEKNQPSGYAGLDGGGKVDVGALPNSVMTFEDFWNASTNTPALADGSGSAGQVYQVNVAGSQNLGSGSQSFDLGDWVVYTGGGVWIKSLNSAAAIPDASVSVSGKVNTVAQSFAGLKTFNDGLASVFVPSSNEHITNKLYVDTGLNTKANDAGVVHIAGAETITGLKTFGEEILVNSTVNAYASVRSLNVASSVIASSLTTGGNGSPTNKYKAIPFTIGSSQTVTSLTLRLRQFTSPQNVTVSICPDVAGDPNEAAPIVSSTTNVSSSAFSDVPFTLTATTLAAGTYWIVVDLPTGIAIEGTSGGGVKYTSDAGATWSADAEFTALIRHQVFAVAAGNSKDIIVASGDAQAGNSGRAVLASGQSTKTLGAAIVVQGLTIQMQAGIGYEGKGTENHSFQIIVDDVNITNPATPVFAKAGSSGQRLIVRVNSATTVDQFMTQYNLQSAAIKQFVITGSGLTTFVDSANQLVAGDDAGEAIIASDWRARVDSSVLLLGLEGTANSQIAINTEKVSGTDSSNTIFILTGQAEGSGQSGGISMRSADMLGSGSSGSVFFRTGLVNGSNVSGSNTISTGGTSAYATANSGNLNLTTGNIGGLSGNSGAINANSGNMQTGSGTSGNVVFRSGSNNISGFAGGTGSATFTSGSMNGTNSGATGSVSVLSGSKTNSGASGATGSVSFASGSNAGSSASGTVSVSSGNQTNAGSSAGSGDININTGTVAGSGNRGTVNITGRYVQITSQVGGNIHLFTETNGSVAFFANGVLKGAINTGSNTVASIAVDMTLAGSNQSATNNLGIQAGSDAGGASAGGNVGISGGNATGGNRNGGSVWIATGVKDGTGLDGDINLTPAGTGKIKLHSSSTIGHVWTASGTDGSGAWQAASGGAGWTSLIKAVADDGFTAANNNEIYADTSGGAFTINLPATPTIGQRVRFFDKKGNWTTNNLTIGRNGSNIKGAAANFAANVNYGVLEFVYSDSTDGWLILNNNG